MLKRVKEVLWADLVKISSLTGVATLVKLAAQFITSKVLAVFVGPAGLAILGQLYNVGNIIQSVGSGGITIGVTKYIAEHSTDDNEVHKLINHALKITFYCSLFCSLIVLVTYPYIGQFAFHTSQYNSVVLALGLTLLLFSFNNLFISIINGLKKFRTYIIINIATSVVNLLITLLFVWLWGVYGALLGFVVSPALMFFVSYLLLKKQGWLSFSFFKTKIEPAILQKFGRFSLIAVNNAIVGSAAQIAIRFLILNSLSIETAGIWDGMNRLSNAYLLLLTTSIQVYYLPTLSAITQPKKLWAEIVRSEKIALPLIILMFTVLYFFRGLVVDVLFSKEFGLMKDVFVYQLIGDVVKIAGWMLAYTMYAKAMTKQLIISDNVFTAFNLVLCYLLIDNYGLKAVYYAYIVNGAVYLTFMYFFIKRSIFKSKTNE